jgi:predicted unusual protein kinase regulating ubiquinone biosynthesis (AarF/ABC1/UbiB family)
VKSAEYITQLQTLQDEVGTFDNELAMRMIEKELGGPLGQFLLRYQRRQKLSRTGLNG